MDNAAQQGSNSESVTPPGTGPDDVNNFKNISPFMSKNLIAAAGFNVETPIVSAIIGNLMGTLPTKKSETETLKCEICDCELPSAVAFELHTNGLRHKKRLNAQRIISELKDANDVSVCVESSDNPNFFRCEICLLTVNSAQQLGFHLLGAKHKKNASKAAFGACQSNPGGNNCGANKSLESTSFPPVKKQKKEESKVISCEICNVFANSKSQYDQHLLSKKHLNRVARVNNFLIN